jgi:hypothetical protein
MYSLRKNSIFRRQATLVASGLLSLAVTPTIGAAALPDACTAPVEIPARAYTMFTLSCNPSPAALDQQINAEDLGDNAAYGKTWLLYQRPNPSSGWSKMAATDELASGKEYNIYTLTPGQVAVSGGGGSGGSGEVLNTRMIFTSDKLSAGQVTAMLNDPSVNYCQEEADAAAATNSELTGRAFVSLTLRSGHRDRRPDPLLSDYPRILATSTLMNVDGSIMEDDSPANWILGWLDFNATSLIGDKTLPLTLLGNPAPVYRTGDSLYTQYVAANDSQNVFYRPLNDTTATVGSQPSPVGFLLSEYQLGRTCIANCEFDFVTHSFTGCNDEGLYLEWPSVRYFYDARKSGVIILLANGHVSQSDAYPSSTMTYSTYRNYPRDDSSGFFQLNELHSEGSPNSQRRTDMCNQPLLRTVCIEVFPGEQL